MTIRPCSTFISIAPVAPISARNGFGIITPDELPILRSATRILTFSKLPSGIALAQERVN